MKAIIHYHEVGLNEALAHVRLVVEEGRVSHGGEQFSYVTQFSDGVLVFADQTRTGTDTFIVQPSPEEEP